MDSERLAGKIVRALGPANSPGRGMNEATIVLPQLARMLTDIRESRDTPIIQVEALVKAHSLHAVLTSLPAVVVMTAAQS